MKTIGNSNRIQPAYTVGNAPTNNVAYTDLANAFTLAQSISLATAGTIFSLTTTENNATPQAVDLYRHRAGAAGQDGDDLTELQFNGLDDNGTPQKTKYARILAEIADASDTTEDGRLSLGTMRAGTVVDWQVESGTLRYQGLTLPATAGYVNAAGYQLNGLALGQTLLQRTTLSTNTFDSTASNIPYDDTKPQNTEGKQIFSQAFTPLSSSSTILLHGIAYVGVSTTESCILSMFNSTTGASAIWADVGQISTNFMLPWPIFYTEASVNTSARTYSLRYGAASNTMYLNGTAGARKLGGALTTYLMIEEWL